MKFNKSKDLARRVGVTEPCIILWRKRGMPYKRVGLNRYEYDWDEVLTWLANQGKREREYVTELLKKGKGKDGKTS